MLAKRLAALLLTAIAALALTGAVSASDDSFYADGYTVNSYDVDVVVGPDGVTAVSERIGVTFSSPRHGIYRYIPTVSRAGYEVNGRSRSRLRYTDISGIKVTDTMYGDASPFTVTRDGGDCIIRIGDPERTLRGEVAYTISYILDGGADGTNAYDELYINLIGTGWDTDIESASFSVSMPADVEASQVSFSSGPEGAQGGPVDFTCNGRSIFARAGEVIHPGEGVSMRILLPDGYFVGASSRIVAGEVIAAIVLCALLAIACAVVWYLYGRDRTPVESVEFYPPEDFSPAQVGYIVNGNAEDKDMLSLIVWWAQKGLLTIAADSSRGMTLTKKLPAPDDMPLHERTLFDALFAGGDTVRTGELDESFVKGLALARRELNNSFCDDPDRQVFDPRSRALRYIMGAAGALIMWIAAAVAVRVLTFNFWLAMGVGALVGAEYYIAYFISGLAGTMYSKVRRVNSGAPAQSITCGVFAAVAALVLSFVSAQPLLCLLCCACAAAASFFAAFTVRRTGTGIQWQGKLMGLRRFIANTERQRLDVLLKDDPSYFYGILPYAYVLGVTDEWIGSFEEIAVNKPAWYSGPGDLTPALTGSMLVGELNGCANRVMAVQGSSSASGGVGGGMGGGGGGSW